MGIFSGLKKKIIGSREESVDDVRSAVLGPYEYPTPASQQELAAGQTQPQQSAPAPQQQSKPIRPWWEEKLANQPAETEFLKPPWEQPLDTREKEDRHLESMKKDYEIMDRLSIIESQLVAIRSQTEKIN